MAEGFRGGAQKRDQIWVVGHAPRLCLIELFQGFDEASSSKSPHQGQADGAAQLPGSVQVGGERSGRRSMLEMRGQGHQGQANATTFVQELGEPQGERAATGVDVEVEVKGRRPQPLSVHW